jgi:hypothetical protein
MMEMLLGLWAANLPALAPIVRCASKHYQASSIYRKFSRSDASGSEEHKVDKYSIVHVKPFTGSEYSRKDSGSMGEQHPLV